MPHASTGRTVAAACLALAAFAAGVAGAQAMYKWVDEKGTTHFSEHPPPDGKKAARVEPKVTPPSSPAAAPPKNDSQSWRAQEAEFRKRQVERGQRDQAEQRERAERGQQCSEARRRLASLLNSSRIYRDHEDGTRTYLNEAQRDATVAEQRARVKEHCD